MRKQYLYFFLFLLFALTNVNAQERDEFGNYNIKKLTQADMERIFGDLYKPGKIFKTQGDPREIKEVIIRGNKITTVVFNYGSICRPNYLGNIADLVWMGLGYGYEFGPLAAAKVLNDNGDSVIIVDDSFILTGQGGYSPDGTLKWGWLPKPGYSDPNSREVATLNSRDLNGDGKPDSWPERWYSPGAGRYVWPAFLGDQATAPDEEVYFVMDDYTNQGYIGPAPYFPFVNDPTKRGLGLDAEVRILQYNNPLAEDIMFLVYQITNVSDKDIPLAYFGMHGDPHVGGPGNFSDDRAFFIPPTGELADPYPQRARSMVYAWDDDMRGDGGLFAGYFGWKFLESPTNSVDGIDNDDDGIIDESPFNSAGFFIDGINFPLTFGIADIAKYTAVFGAPRQRWSGDEDGDWDPEKDDIGIDGIGPDSPNYPGPDYGEADGRPSQAFYLDLNGNFKYDIGEPINDERLPGYLWAGSEPNFGLRDVSESDQLGLTSFNAAQYTNSLPNVPKNTALMWEWLSSGVIDPNQNLLNNPGDNIFNFGTGPLALQRGESQRFSMSILFGINLNSLVLNAETSTRILESDYRFAKPPEKPIVRAVPGDGRVTLYWDTRAEDSFDPFLRVNDFQGYKIYRSQDYTFRDVFTITDGNGSPFLGQPLFNSFTGKSAQFDLIDSLSGFHPIDYLGRGVKYYLGNNTGLVHEYVDSTVKNGLTYYYAVVSYDGGSIQFGLPPTESQAVIGRDPITNELQFDVNTVQATPGPKPAGVVNAIAGINGKPAQLVGNSTGDVRVKVLEDYLVENKLYTITFVDSLTYNVLDSTGKFDSFISKDTVFVDLSNQNLIESSFEVYDAANILVPSSNYILNAELGKVRSASPGLMPAGSRYTVKYRYYPVYRSKLLNNEDANPTFDGLRVYAKKDPLMINYSETKFINNDNITIIDTVLFPPSIGNPRIHFRGDWEVIWNNLDTLADGSWANPGDTVLNQTNQQVIVPFRIFVTSHGGIKASYRINETVAALRNGRWDWGEAIILQPPGAAGATTTYEIRFSLPTDSIARANAKLPRAGDIFQVRTSKPFQAGDTYQFTTEATKFNPSIAAGMLDNIYAVPNPYVGYSSLESPGRTIDSRGDRKIQFRNLPPQCTIRIYTITGELVQTIEKNDQTSIADWNLLSSEGQRIAYGVYIYHVDAPGAGEVIGRLGIIK